MRKSPLVLILYFLFFSISSNAQGYLWAKSPSGYGVDCEAWLISTDKHGDIITCGRFSYLAGTADSSLFGTERVVDTGNFLQMVVTKMDSTGTFLWAWSTQRTSVKSISMAVDTFGNTYVLGVYSNTPHTPDTVSLGHSIYLTSSEQRQYFVAKINPSGTTVWARNIAPDDNLYNDIGCLAVDAVGNAYVTCPFIRNILLIDGTTITNHDISGTTYDFFVVRFDTFGNTSWVKSFGGDSSDYVYAAATDVSGNFYITGVYRSDTVRFDTASVSKAIGTGYANIFTAKFDPAGSLIWVNASSNTASASFSAMTTDIWGNLYAVGTYEDTVILGSSTIHGGTAGEMLLAKYDPNGNVKWVKTTVSTSTGYGVSADNCGNIWISGHAGGYLYLDGHTYTMPFPDFDDMFVAEYDTSGSFSDCLILPMGGDDMNGLKTDNHGNVYIVGDIYVTSAPVILVNDTLLPIPALSAYEQLFITRYAYLYPGCTTIFTTQAGNNSRSENEIALYPDPSWENFTVSSAIDFLAGSKAELYDLSGKLQRTISLQGNGTTVSVADIPPGMYLCKIYSAGDNNITTKKLVVMH